MRLLLFLLPMVPLAAQATDSCAPVDLRACLGAPRDQGETGWCFATTTADLASCALGARVSATDIALTYHLAPATLPGLRESVGAETQARFGEWAQRPYPIRDSFDVGWNGKLPDYKGLYSMGGEEDIAFLAAAARGFCADERLTSGPLADVANISEARELARRGLEPGASQRLPHVPEDARYVAEAFWAFADQRCGQRIFPQQRLRPVHFEIAQDSAEILRLRKGNAASYRVKRAELIKVIDEHLSRGRAVAAGMDTRDMTTPEWSGEDPEHSIVFAGRKRIGGQCHYFVRNTGGSDCSIYLRKLNPQTRCDPKAGGIWVPMEFIPSLYSATAIEVAPRP